MLTLLFDDNNANGRKVYKIASHPPVSIDQDRIEGRIMRYSLFIPKFYNLCKSTGFETGKILPSRAFCCDGSES